MSEPDIKRKLATILVADVVEYSRLAATDEDWAVGALADFRMVVDEIIARHDGRIFSTGGDSILAEFASPVEAVRAAVDFQEAARSRNLLQARERQLRFRLGINLGDVIVRGSDLLGDGVNVAARLEALAEPGGICISGTVWDQINGKLSLGYVDLGEQSVKNIPRPIRAYRLKLDSGIVEEIVEPRARALIITPTLRIALAAVVPVLFIIGLVGWYLWPESRIVAASSRTGSYPGAATARLPPVRAVTEDAHGFRPGQSFRDCPSCPEMLVLRAGHFMMGAAPGDHERFEVPPVIQRAELPQHSVTIARPFAIGKFDVTRAEFAAFVEATTYRPARGCSVLQIRKEASAEGQTPEDKGKREWVQIEKFSWRDPSYGQTDRDPVVCVNTSDIEAYLRWLRSETGRPYRLPSDSEWEYAARGNTTTLYHWGDDPDQVCLYENVFDETAKEISNPGAVSIPCRDGYGQSAPVGSFKENPFGLYDMVGNVSVFTADCWNATYDDAPTDGSVWRKGDCTHHVIRKASFSHFQPWVFRSSTRFSQIMNNRHSRTGFRVAVSLQ